MLDRLAYFAYALAVATYQSNHVQTLLGNGAGSFIVGGGVTVGGGPQFLATGDFNGDGKQDLAVTNQNSNNVTILLGNGTGSFSSAKIVGVGTSPESIVVGNFNGDGVVVDQTILSGPNAPNFATKTICAQSLSFSPFVIASVDDHTPPSITDVAVSPSVIWPPDHKMIDVTVSYDVADDFSSASDIQTSLSVSSNEPANTTGDGNTEPDIEIVDEHHVRVRAERSGDSNDRVYTITIAAIDQAQNTSTRTVTVVVPKSQK